MTLFLKNVSHVIISFLLGNLFNEPLLWVGQTNLPFAFPHTEIAGNLSVGPFLSFFTDNNFSKR
jgi:hypothetical protein